MSATVSVVCDAEQQKWKPGFSFKKKQMLKNSKVCSKVAEFACSACFLCVCCPLSIAWCCIKLPCKIGWRAARRATHWACYGSNQKIVAAYSSFSDIDSDSMPCKSHTCSKELSPPIQRIG
ncbi:Phospholipid scramblase [Melia azedarach]|uniref:Phospholipid scramblase n=1 Tax=Melia azedarach TaxID=155640 RepID=A0ACC1XRS6_MELAZ|nr:Phospholipid scramblase [Melia azedarach]